MPVCLLQGLDLRTIKFAEVVDLVKIKRLSLRGNKHVQMDESLLKRMLAPGKAGKFKHSTIAGCNAFASMLAKYHEVQQKVLGSTRQNPSKGKSRETSAMLDSDTKDTSGAQGPTGMSSDGALNSARASSKDKKPANHGPDGSGKKPSKVTNAKKSDMNLHDNTKSEVYDNPYFNAFAISLSENFAAAFFPAEYNACEMVKLLLLCHKNERTYCREKVEEVGMCAKLAAQSESVSVFCEEDVVQSETCHEYFDPAVPRSICHPSCGDSVMTSKFTLDWNASGAAGCESSICEPSEVVFCEGGEAVGTGCNFGDCLADVCLEFSFGTGSQTPSDYISIG